MLAGYAFITFDSKDVVDRIVDLGLLEFGEQQVRNRTFFACVHIHCGDGAVQSDVSLAD